MQFHIITIFPESMESYFATSILARAQKEQHIDIHFYNPRDFTEDKHKTVDDKPYGGGAGMVMKAIPIISAVQAAQESIAKSDATRTKIVLLSAKGSQYTQTQAQKWQRDYDNIIIIAGRYEGIDERVKEILGAYEISIGPYVLTDGELPAMILISSISRLIPSVITRESLAEESSEGNTEYPHYTRPEYIEYNGNTYRYCCNGRRNHTS